jgi:hypothetical protein
MSAPDLSGGRAFPTLYIDPNFGSGYDGMNLRDYFAGQALAGTLSNPHADWMKCDLKDHAAFAYEVADDMIRQKKEGPIG